MNKKPLLSLVLAAMLACSALFGCAAPASSSSAASAEPSSSQAASSASAQARDEATIEATVEFDLDLLEGTAEAEGIAPFRGPMAFELQEGATAYDALAATGVEIDGSPSFVSGINGAGEGLAGSASGWMYMVNDEVPSVSADQYVLEDGDQVVWYYGSWS